MENELEPDSGDDVLEKVDALLKKHQNRAFHSAARTASPAPVPAPEPTPPAMSAADSADFDDDIPTLTDVVETSSPSASPTGTGYTGTPPGLARDLEVRLCRELESRIAPQLSAAFGQVLDELLEQARQRISETVHQQLEQELKKSAHPTPGKPGGETQV